MQAHSIASIRMKSSRYGKLQNIRELFGLTVSCVSYNKYVANQTLEDYSLRYTARSVRKLDVSSVVMTSIGSISFLALEVIGANIAIFYGLNHLILALLITVPLIFVLSHPIAKYASIHHIDIDLLTRGAGFVTAS